MVLQPVDKKSKRKPDRRLPLDKLVQMIQRCMRTPICRNKVCRVVIEFGEVVCMVVLRTFLFFFFNI